MKGKEVLEMVKSLIVFGCVMFLVLLMIFSTLIVLGVLL